MPVAWPPAARPTTPPQSASLASPSGRYFPLKKSPYFIITTCCRFDVVFDGSNSKLTLTTAPGAPATHWQQMRCLFQQPLSVRDGDCLVGKVTLRATRQQSYIAHGSIR